MADPATLVPNMNRYQQQLGRVDSNSGPSSHKLAEPGTGAPLARAPRPPQSGDATPTSKSERRSDEARARDDLDALGVPFNRERVIRVAKSFTVNVAEPTSSKRS